MTRTGEMSNNYTTEPTFDLPRIIDTPYPYISIHDLHPAMSALASIPDYVATNLEELLERIRIDAAPENCTFYQVDAEAMVKSLEMIVDTEIQINGSLGVIHMDKHIGLSQQGENFARLHVSRGSNGELTSRVGVDIDVNQQIENLVAWSDAHQFDEIMFVDDVLAYGDTIPVIIDSLHERGLSKEITLRTLVGVAASGGSWKGVEKMQNAVGIDTEFLTKVYASQEVAGGSSGMAIPVSRDLTILGGRVTTLEDNSKRTHPYMLPFSKPLSSIIKLDSQFEVSKRLLAFNLILVEELEKHSGRTLLIQDLIDANIGLPHTSLKSLDGIMSLPRPEMQLTEYLEYSLSVLEDNKGIILQECEPTPN